jgi:hypothetical protein
MEWNKPIVGYVLLVWFPSTAHKGPACGGPLSGDAPRFIAVMSRNVAVNF